MRSSVGGSCAVAATSAAEKRRGKTPRGGVVVVAAEEEAVGAASVRGSTAPLAPARAPAPAATTAARLPRRPKRRDVPLPAPAPARSAATCSGRGGEAAEAAAAAARPPAAGMAAHVAGTATADSGSAVPLMAVLLLRRSMLWLERRETRGAGAAAAFSGATPRCCRISSRARARASPAAAACSIRLASRERGAVCGRVMALARGEAGAADVAVLDEGRACTGDGEATQWWNVVSVSSDACVSPLCQIEPRGQAERPPRLGSETGGDASVSLMDELRRCGRERRIERKG